MPTAVANHLLFSEVFFQQIRQETADLDNLRATLGTIQDTWRYYLPPPANDSKLRWQPEGPIDLGNVTQLRVKVVEQIFAYLELTYGPCAADSRAFFLYGDWEMQDRTGLCLVLPYSTDIEGRNSQGIIPKGRNYAQQLIRLLRDHDLDWGVLTNGRHWRLYHRSELSPTDTFLDIDLERIVVEGDMRDYVVFHRFFSRLAFARQESRQRLDVYKQQSDAAAKTIESHLSSQVEEIVRQLCQGLVESCRARDEDVADGATRSDIYKNSLFLVYRLLFVLYAEARELLPLEIPAYRGVCLADLLEEVRRNHQDGLAYDDDYTMWTRLQALFALIDQGDSMAGVPAYNGGLFAAERRRFLVDHQIRNSYLQAALIRLSAVPTRGKTYDKDRQPQPIDYRDLSVRHLGSLYEGLLEYNLFVVEGDARVVRSGKKHTEYVPVSAAGKVRANETVLQVGDVYFSETEGERKATGSFYTPEDVVDYIVRNTVVQKLQDLRTEFYSAYQIQRQLDDLANTPLDIPAYHQIQRALDEQFRRFVLERILTLKILDMAMGSGHFLVNVIHAVANFIVDFLNETPWENEEIDTDVASWRRRVAERCVFGVDLNELAVELAKLCLWMTTAAKGKPLTFLDHHLRWGNSLVGAWSREIGRNPLAKKEGEQAFTLPVNWFQLKLDGVLAKYQELYAKSSDDVDEVREKARIFEQGISQALQPYRELFTVHTTMQFGNRLDVATYARLGAAAEDATTWATLKTELGLDQAIEEHRMHRMFHWELEFPEVFYASGTGFDIIVGNPPYVRQEKFANMKPYLANAFKDVYHGTADLYVYFVGRTVSTLCIGGRFGLIVANKWLRSDYAAPLREFLVQQTSPRKLIDFGHSDVFPGADTFPCILIDVHQIPGDSSSQTVLFSDVSGLSLFNTNLEDFVSEAGFEVPYSSLSRSGWMLEPPGVTELLLKLRTQYSCLRDQAGIDAIRGIITGFNEAFYINTVMRDQLLSADPNCELLLHRLLRGRNIKRWHAQWSDEWMLAIPSSADQKWRWSKSKDDQEAEDVFRASYPSLHAHLKPFEAQLKQRLDQGRFWWELRACDFYDALERPKIIVQTILYHSVFALDTRNRWINQLVYLLTTDDKFILAALNSRILWWYMYRTWPHMKDEALSTRKPGLLSLPIPDVETDLRSQISELVDRARQHTTEVDLKSLYDVEMQLQECLEKAYGMTQAEVKLMNQTLPPRDPLEVLARKLSSRVFV